MRPDHLNNPKSRLLRFKLWAVTKIIGSDKPPEPLKIFFARPKFAKAIAPMMRDMHSPDSFWSVGARELMATHVAARFQCPF